MQKIIKLSFVILLLTVIILAVFLVTTSIKKEPSDESSTVSETESRLQHELNESAMSQINSEELHVSEGEISINISADISAESSESKDSDFSSTVSQAIGNISDSPESSGGKTPATSKEETSDTSELEIDEPDDEFDNVGEVASDTKLDAKRTFSIQIKDSDGNPVSNADVMLGDETGKTDSKGLISLSCEYRYVEMSVSCRGYASYYEEMDAGNALDSIEIFLANTDRLYTLINGAELHPYKTDNETLNKQIDTIFDSILSAGMTTYDKVVACYEWVITHMVYQQPRHNITPYTQHYWECASQAISEGTGNCCCYSAIFTAMMRRIGLDCCVMYGYTSASGGGYTKHYWTDIKIGNDYYIFDCQVEDAIANRTSTKTIGRYRFCLEEPNTKYKYSVYSINTDYQSFTKYVNSHGTFE